MAKELSALQLRLDVPNIYVAAVSNKEPLIALKGEMLAKGRAENNLRGLNHNDIISIIIEMDGRLRGEYV